MDWATGTTPLPIRWVLVRDPAGQRPLCAFFTTEPHALATAIIGTFVKRWSLDVTFEEGRAPLGIETQRQSSLPAIARTGRPLAQRCLAFLVASS